MDEFLEISIPPPWTGVSDDDTELYNESPNRDNSSEQDDGVNIF
jgi:hypothetical protein